MANRIWRESESKNIGVVNVEGSFAPNGASAVDSASNMGSGWSVVRTSTGLFTITLADSYVGCYAANCSLQLATGDDKFAQLGSIDVTTAKTIQIRIWDVSAAAVADVAANANNRINFSLQLKNTTVSY